MAEFLPNSSHWIPNETTTSIDLLPSWNFIWKSSLSASFLKSGTSSPTSRARIFLESQLKFIVFSHKNHLNETKQNTNCNEQSYEFIGTYKSSNENTTSNLIQVKSHQCKLLDGPRTWPETQLRLPNLFLKISDNWSSKQKSRVLESSNQLIRST